jgi:hypothetical protein
MILGKDPRKTAIPFTTARREQERKNELADVFCFLESRSQTILKEVHPCPYQFGK